MGEDVRRKIRSKVFKHLNNINMEENTQTQESPKLTYEQLNNAAMQLSQQNMQLRKQLEEMNYFNLFRRLDYLFKVVEFSTNFSADFVTACTTEIQALLTTAEEMPEDNTEEKA